MKTFLVTGHGRSGTHFLARALDRSLTWKVTHEAIGPLVGMNQTMINRHYKGRDHYGMVNNYCRWHALGSKCGTLAVISRNPFDIALSHHNRGTWKGNFTKFLSRDFKWIDKLLEADEVQVIPFHLMTTDLDYFHDVARALGVTDLTIDEETLRTKISVSKGTDTKLPRHRYDQIKKAAGWFADKWFS